MTGVIAASILFFVVVLEYSSNMEEKIFFDSSAKHIFLTLFRRCKGYKKGAWRGGSMASYKLEFR